MSNDALQRILDKDSKRYLVLRALYDESNASTLVEFKKIPLREALGLKTNDYYDILEYLSGEGLATITLATVAITHWGIREVEESIKNPDRSTKHFHSIVIQNFYGSVQGGVQTGGQNNTQEVLIDSKRDETQ